MLGESTRRERIAMKRNSVRIEHISLIIAGLMALTGVSTYAQESGWQEIPPFRPIIQYLDIEFSSRDSGFFSTHTSELFRTIDGGKNWEPIKFPPAIRIQIQQIQSLPNGLWFICGISGVAYSTNFGESWTTVGYDPDELEMQTDCSFMNEKVGVVSDYNARVGYTTDGGKSWRPLVVDTDPIDAARFVSMSQSGAIGIATGFGKIFVTTDEGATYLADSCQGVGWRRVQFVDDSTIVAVGVNQESNASILFRSDDCGKSWDSILVDSSYDAHDVRFINRKTGLIVGSLGGDIFRTDDGGATWRKQYAVTDPTLGLNYVTMVNDSVAYVLGNRIMLKTTTGGWTTTSVPFGLGTLEEKSTLTIYPYPASNVLSIHFYDSSISGTAHVSVISYTGEVAMNTLAQVHDGWANLNISNLAQGEYALRLLINKDVFTECIQVMR